MNTKLKEYLDNSTTAARSLEEQSLINVGFARGGQAVLSDILALLEEETKTGAKVDPDVLKDKIEKNISKK